MSGLNKVTLLGHLGADPEYKSDRRVCTIRLATSESWRDKESGAPKENTEWHRVVAFGRTAEIMHEYLRKGSQVCIEGKIKTDKWQDADGNDRFSTNIVASNIILIDKKTSGPATQSTADASPADSDDVPF